jgi:hypothetical protein
VAVHPRATRPGERATVTDHLPPAKVEGLLTRRRSVSDATDIGPDTATLIGRVLGDRPLDRLRTAAAVLRLAHKYATRRLEAAYGRALRYDDLGYATIKRILVDGLDHEPTPAVTTAPLAAAAIRAAVDGLLHGHGRRAYRVIISSRRNSKACGYPAFSKRSRSGRSRPSPSSSPTAISSSD